MATYVRFTEKPGEQIGSSRKRKEASHLYVNVDEVGMVLPRTTYTTLCVQGKYVHVDHSYAEVFRMLRASGEIT